MTNNGVNNRGIKMVISPAKTLDLSPLNERELEMVDHETIATISSAKYTSLCNYDKTNEIVNIMKKKSEAELKSLLSLSPALAKVSHQYWQDLSMDNTNKRNDEDDDALFAVFTFNGPAFQGISAHNCNVDTLSYMGQNLFILDAVFGVLRSLDTLQPYRLEMGCKGIVASNINNAKGKKETLASYWKDSVTTYLGKELIKSSCSSKGNSSPAILANLASDEYSSSIDIASLPPNTIYINTIFRHQGRVLAVHAKRARGLMARYLCETNAQTLEDVSKFNLENYTCIESDGGNNNKWEVIDVVGDNVQVIQMIFDRSEAPPKANTGKRTAASSSKKGTKKAKKK